MKKVLLVGMIGLFALTACARPEPIQAQEIIDERAEYRATAAPQPETWDITAGYREISREVKRAILEKYDVVKVKIIRDEHYLAKDRWLESFVSQRLDPAVVHVLVDDGEWYEYQVVLLNNEVTLIQLHEERPETPDPDTLLQGAQ